MSVLMSSIGLLYLMFDLSFYQNWTLYVGDIFDCFLLNNYVGISYLTYCQTYQCIVEMFDLNYVRQLLIIKLIVKHTLTAYVVCLTT
jgi:hypothetical protein